ncbi:hypothetical protein C5167_036560 [Papaver somniferum]|uniref:Uncharacterized protein n=1 Tax=Papaver somniferum TaxID=3469 RepID=A0A4Y7I7W6_PAPSO|nr:hypothetical protein C5167_036560 [Papaver somniferum]
MAPKKVKSGGAKQKKKRPHSWAVKEPFYLLTAFTELHKHIPIGCIAKTHNNFAGWFAPQQPAKCFYYCNSVYSYRYLSPAYRNDHFVFIDTTSTPKNVGLTRGLALDVWMNANKGKLVVMFSELNGEPLFENGPKLVNECVMLKKFLEESIVHATTVSNNEGIHKMLHAEADRIQAQEEQICAQNEVIKKLKEDSAKDIRNMQDMMLRSLGLNNITANGIEN